MGKQIRYTREYKVKTVQMYLQGDLSANQLALDLGIHPHTVRHWIQDYNDGKLGITMPPNNKECNFLNVTAHEPQDASRRPDIGILLCKINVLESEINELKAILQKYLIKW